MAHGATGRTFYRGEAGYEETRSAAVKNARLPHRFPDVIVQAASDADVIAAVRLAKRNGLKIGVRSGGHSWAGAFLRDGGMLRSADLLWAARGAGPGFFGVVTRFYLTVYPRPKAFLKSDYVYPIEVYDEVLRFVHAVQPKLSRAMECLVFTRRDILGHKGPGALLTAPVIADSAEEAREALAILEACPVRAKAVMADVNASGSLDQWLQGAEDLLYPPGARYAADNMWTHAPVEALLPGMRDIARTLPDAPSHMMWMLWGPSEPRPDMAFSMEDDLYIALYSVWRDEREDARHQAWVTDHMKALEPHASGIQLADENLAARPFKFIAAANLARLETLRAKYDPGGLFHSYMGTPRSG
jgi:FAD/FMN-containing dehydrogenase